MATAKVTFIKKEVVTIIDEPAYGLDLSQVEARTLVDVLEMISGLPGTRRDHTGSILNALRSLGVCGTDSDTHYPEDVSPSYCNIQFL
jgi:hypothetical protein